MTNKVLIIGGGIAGIKAALDLADAGIHVIMVEKSPTIGGKMALLDKVFPTLDCSICIEAPMMSEVMNHPNITVYTLSEVIGLDGEPGKFRVKILKKPRFVTDECTRCGKCSEVCSELVPNIFDGGLSYRKAIYTPFSQAEPGAYVIDIEHCLNDPPNYLPCDKCINACEVKAIDFSMREEIIEEEVAAIIVAVGYSLLDPSTIPNYNYGKYPDVITSFELDRMLNASGPTQGHIIRPSDGREPESVLLVTCVGSRDARLVDYCSRFCCMYTLKHAIQLVEHGIKNVSILFMDIRAYGKGFERFYERAKEEGVRILRGRLAAVNRENGKMVAYYEDVESGEVRKIDADLMVLATAAIPNRDLKKLAEILGIELDKDGFIKTRAEYGDPVSTTREGIFVCGSASGPKDIADSVIEASAAAAKAAKYVKERHWPKDEYEERDVSGEPPKIGVIICDCGSNIAGVCNVPKLVEMSQNIPNVAYSEELRFACSGAGQKRIMEIIEEHKLNRLVVAACSPATHLRVFKNAAKKVGLNPYLVEMANIRNLDSWVHRDDKEGATLKAYDYIKMAVGKAKYLRPMKEIEVPVHKRVLVVGGGPAGMAAAAALANMGFETHLVEKSSDLGGMLNKLRYIAPEGVEAKVIKERLLEELSKSGAIIHLNTVVEQIDGFVGNFHVKLSDGTEFDAGAIIFATGIKEYQPSEFGYGNNNNVLTLLDLEHKLDEIENKNVVMLACIGSRNGKFGCSRYCCQTMLFYAKKLREKGNNVVVVAKDIRTYSRGAEELYKEVSKMGVLFVKVDRDKPMEELVEVVDGKVKVFDKLTNAKLAIPYDYIVLVNGMRADETGVKLAEMVKAPRDEEGFLLESHPKLGPAESPNPGIFLAGGAQGPKTLEEAIAHGLAAASKAASLIARGVVEKEPFIPVIDDSKCVKCLLCAKVCTYNAIRGELRKWVEVIPAACMGCGSCVSECPTGAITIPGFSDQEIFEQIDAALEEKPWEKAIAFTCAWCSYAAADNAGIAKYQYPLSPRIIRVMCSARISWNFIKRAFEKGAAAVLVSGCRIGDCHYQNANLNTVRRFKIWQRKIKRELGVEDDRMILQLMSAAEAPLFVETMKRLDSIVKKYKDILKERLSKQSLGGEGK